MPHLFINSSIDGHLSFFHLLGIVSSVAVNIMDKFMFENLLSILLYIYLTLGFENKIISAL